MIIDSLLNAALLIFLLVMALTLLYLPGLLAMTMVLGLYSLLVASLFMVMDAPDVALTEAAVGSGVATVLMLVTLSLVNTRYEKTVNKLQWRPLLLVSILGGVLMYGTHDLAAWGDPAAPANQHVADRYISQGLTQTGVPNIVTAVLASYRGFDTLGEVVVVFTAGLGIMILLRRT